jgi:hypothetical protein
MAKARTAEQVAQRKESSALRRQAIRDARKELLMLVQERGLELEVSAATLKWLQGANAMVTRTTYDLKEGLSIADLFIAHPGLSYRKLVKKAKEAGLTIKDNVLVKEDENV